ncbi:hypothetical protein [Tessaracoccus antarcticus]|uniref:Uncharacterized protein n=1 Tax=Tessaracoccus antarcticus TaxID=2479848 RepID=A0A3M0GAZ4_9ACTN|nr:hypothetical protein [Tessaracoccus antarcticus]RMB61598.1 hypothetical protein EAX62_02915 [Tessaracoccus antarcticus]
MWTQDGFPGADKVPWQLLIRARFVDEIDAIVAHTVVTTLAPLMGKERGRHLAGVAAGAVMTDGAQRVELGAEQKMAALSAFTDWDGEICPVGWPWPWPWPKRPRWFGEFDDPAILLALDAVRALTRGAGSKQLAAAVDEAVGQGQLRR